MMAVKLVVDKKHGEILGAYDRAPKRLIDRRAIPRLIDGDSPRSSLRTPSTPRQSPKALTRWEAIHLVDYPQRRSNAVGNFALRAFTVSDTDK
jgi:hypothetical protein